MIAPFGPEAKRITKMQASPMAQTLTTRGHKPDIRFPLHGRNLHHHIGDQRHPLCAGRPLYYRGATGARFLIARCACPPS